MSGLRAVPVVEGHGEVAAVRILLDRIWRELIGGEYVDILQPVRVPRSKLLRHDGGRPEARLNEAELERAVTLAAHKLKQRQTPPLPSLIVILLDANSDCPKELASQIVTVARAHAGMYPVDCVLAKPEYETWFVAAAESLGKYLALSPPPIPDDPESANCRKKWVADRFRGTYSETADQPKLTAAMDLESCRERSRSFRKLCKILQSQADQHKT